MSVMKKLKNNEELNKAEQKFLNDLKEIAMPCNEDTVLWRVITPYEGFDDEINNGCHVLKSLISTNKTYDDFFDYWTDIKPKKKGDKFIGIKPVYLKIKVPKGTPVIDCKVKHNLDRSRMDSETVLLPGKCIVDSIDEDLDVIEMTYKMD